MNGGITVLFGKDACRRSAIITPGIVLFLVLAGLTAEWLLEDNWSFPGNRREGDCTFRLGIR